MMETLLTAIEDAYPSVIKYIFQSHQMFLLTLCSGFAIASLFFITQVQCKKFDESELNLLYSFCRKGCACFN